MKMERENMMCLYIDLRGYIALENKIFELVIK